MLEPIKNFEGLNITFNTTETCNLACKYCYEIEKKTRNLDLDKAKKFIDLLLTSNLKEILNLSEDEENEHKHVYRGIILDFIGGDSFMNVELMEKIIQYWIYKVNILNTENAKMWRNMWRISISTNGTLFSNPKVREFCTKYRDVMSVGISIDGCPEIHDKNRIFAVRGPNGEEIGSMNEILKYRESFVKKALALETYRNTKSTLSKDSIPYLFKSLKFMYGIGVTNIHQNFIMEDAGLVDEDYFEFDKQMELCVNYVLEHCDELYWSMIDKDFFASHEEKTSDPKHKQESKCGSGCMPALSIDGKIYPCFRWLPHTQTGATKDKMVVGDIENGFTHPENFAKVREGGKYGVCSKEQRCQECKYSSACAYCIGGCYAEFGDFVRTTYICEIAKMQCKWAKIYWNEYNKLKGLPMEFDEKFQLCNVDKLKWTPEYKGTNTASWDHVEI